MKEQPYSFLNKQYDIQSIQATLQNWRSKKENIVFTNGCFDLIHYGHIHYLSEAAALGDRLIVGMNSDASVRRLKGQHRPIKDQKNRLAVMAAFSFVDAVILFEEDTPYNLIRAIQPDMLVKGGDWRIDQIVGSDIVIGNGGIVKSLEFIKGYSTTALEHKIRKNNL